MRRRAIILIAALAAISVQLAARDTAADPRLKNAQRLPERNGWIFVHLEGSPRQIGFQHGWLLAPEIKAARKSVGLLIAHESHKNWQFFRDAAQRLLWPKIDPEYREEMEGIAEGLKARGVNFDVWDVVVLNASMELSGYYVPWLEQQQKKGGKASSRAPEHCSAFVATGSYTKDGRVVIGHNAWTDYADGRLWNIVYDIKPASGHRILMDGFPGRIHSSDDFGMNSAGILITETTISRFSGWDSNGIPEFVRARKAMQYASSIDDFARIMKEGNNGGYANNWLVADTNTNEIASLELGLKNVNLIRTKDGFIGGANFPVNERLTKEETEFDPKDLTVSGSARRVRWAQLEAEYKGRIDVETGKKFLSDHYDTYAKKEDPNERTLCGHIDLSPRGSMPWQPGFGPSGAVQAKVTDAAMAGRMSFAAAMGHSCGISFKADAHLKKHPEFGWQKAILGDLDSHPWTVFQTTPR